MGIRSKKNEYRSFNYLDKKKDFKNFDLSPEYNSFKSFLIPLTMEEEEEVKDIARKMLMISLHDHAVVLPKSIRKLFYYTREGRIFTAYSGLSESYWDVIFDAFMASMSAIRHSWRWSDIINEIGMRFCDLAHQDFVIRCEKIKDIFMAFKNGKISFIPTLESSTMIENELDRIDILYGLGIRMMGITYSESNSLGTGLREDKDGGLTYFGYKAVERMNKLGMAIDCAHASDQTTIDVIKASKEPIFISHIGAKGLRNIRRFKPDDILKLCANNGGIIGIEAATNTTITNNNPVHNIESFMEHFEYIKDLVGIDHVAFGPDTFFGDQVGMQHIVRASRKDNVSIKNDIYKEAKYAEGIENTAEASKNIVRWLVKHKYSRENIKKVLSGNIIRVLKEVWF